jgi:hypothetical protein
VQTVECAWCGFSVFRQGDRLLPGAGTEIHQATAESKQYRSQSGRGDGQGFGVCHGNIPEITIRLGRISDSWMTAV